MANWPRNSYRDGITITFDNLAFSNAWVAKVGELLGISPQKVNAWMKRYLPEFYESVCFKRKAPLAGVEPASFV